MVLWNSFERMIILYGFMDGVDTARVVQRLINFKKYVSNIEKQYKIKSKEDQIT